MPVVGYHRQLFISRERASRRHMGGVALAGMINNRKAFGVGLPGVYHAAYRRCRRTNSSGPAGTWGADLADDLQRYCAMYGGENIAAVFVEPRRFVRLPATAEGLSGPPACICDQHGILLVFDE